ncbi:MAG: hypothetical protein JST55_03540 [Bacteroidetes bacterium]|nr:hypothetical protein [Bacteroidota bacterium]
MIQSKSFTILSTFTPEEFNRFGSFISSPYFNSSSELINFFKLIRKYYPEFHSKSLDFKKIYKKLYPHREYKEGTVRNLLSDLGKLAQKYIGFIKYEESAEFRLNVLKALKEKSLEKLFIKNYKSFYEANEKDPWIELKNLNSYLLKREMISFTQRQATEYKNNFETDNTVDLFVFFLKSISEKVTDLKRLQYRYNTFKGEQLPQKILDSIELKGVIDFLKKNKFKEAEELEIEYKLNSAEKLTGDEFERAISEAYFLIKKYQKRYTRHELYIIYRRITSVIDNNCEFHQKAMLNLLFEIRKDFADKFLNTKWKHRLSASDFKSIIDTALVVKKYDWAKNFLETKGVYLDESIKKDFYYLYMARIYHYLRDFEKSNIELAKSASNHAMIKLDIKILRLLNLYELAFYDSAFSFAGAASQHLKKNKFISEDIKIFNLNFLKIYRLILKAKSGDQISNEVIHNEFEKVKKFTRFAPWIISKLNTL